MLQFILNILKARARHHRHDASEGNNISDILDHSAPFSFANSRSEYRKQFEKQSTDYSLPSLAFKVPFKSIAQARVEMGQIVQDLDPGGTTFLNSYGSVSWPSRLVNWWCRTGRQNFFSSMNRGDTQSFDGRAENISEINSVDFSVQSSLGEEDRWKSEPTIGEISRYYANVRVCQRW